MILYRLITVRLIKYFDLADVFLPPVETKPSEIVKLKVNEQYLIIISVLLTILCLLNCFTVPFAVLEKPFSITSRNELLYHIMKYIETKLKLIDYVMIALFLLIVYVTVITILDAIKNTDIKISPWVLKGKYFPRDYKPPIDPRDALKPPPDPYGAMEIRMNRLKVKTPKYEKRDTDNTDTYPYKGDERRFIASAELRRPFSRNSVM